ncbi:menaquinone-specific isochorismate synthase [Bacillus tianshenii]|uniref:Isochorismate synthase MenF n=1 Tax=Sutcliffiella tianshenii TaxID=1463404 RepID=A0ABS2P3D3_9BACI|nr:isochorismate synthase [Bacillus tianshenii]MBM7621453.1 menaquinone-specific isochorismate synthase [Bacillus tianshenii]
MITKQFHHILGLWEEAKVKASNINQPVLISYTEKVDQLDPLKYFKASARHFPGQRFYWSNPTKSHVMVGAGVAKEFTANGTQERFHGIEKEWKRFSGQSLKNQDNQKIGPVIYGGFSFDPKKEKTKLWDNFADALFVLPTIMFTSIDNENYMTINYWSDSEESHLQELMRIKEELGKGSSISHAFAPEIVKCLEMDPNDWKESIQTVTNRISDGVMDKVVLARELRVLFNDEINVDHVLENLLEEQSNSYLFTVERGSDCFIGATPEQLVKKDSNHVHSMCLAGSIGRGATLQEDEKLGKNLLTDNKNIHEHELVVQMIKSALQEVCHDVTTPTEPNLYKMKHIQHLHTPVTANTGKEVTLADLVNLLHPTPALGGYPREISMETIREVEKLDRGWYAGPLGWMDEQNDGEFIVAIRSGLLQGKEASLFAGCGIVGDSDPESEYRETQMKFRPMLSALGGIKES